MSHLSDVALFGTSVPASWEPLVRLVGGLRELLERQERGAHIALLRAEATRLRCELIAHAEQLGEATPAALRADSPEHRRWFTEAVLLWTRFGESGGTILVDSLGSTTLPLFTADFDGGEAERAQVRLALRRTFGWSEAELEELERSLQARTSNLAVKNAIADSFAQAVASGPAAERGARIAALARRVYGQLPLRPGDVELVLTSTSILFCFPFEGAKLVRPDFEARPESERAAVAAFLERLQKANNSFDTIRFPAFGLYDRGAVEPALVAELTAAAQGRPGLARVNQTVVAETLASMVTVVPALDAERFLIHDIWGHGWEESLCDFEWSYAQLSALRAPLHGAELRAAFVVAGGRVRLDRDAWRIMVAGDLRRRLTVALNVVLAECLADLVEHKYVRRRGEVPELPSSSLLPLAPLKIDLSVRDTQALLRAAHRPYRRLDRPEESARLIAELVAAGLPGEGLTDAVDQAVALVRETFGSALDTRMVIGAPRNGAFAVDLAQRVMLGIVALDAALEQYLARAACPAGEARWLCPRGSIDLLVLLLAWFYEQDRSVNFWHLDELLRHELGPTTERFQRELRAVVGRGLSSGT